MSHIGRVKTRVKVGGFSVAYFVKAKEEWIPAFAGMTSCKVVNNVTNIMYTFVIPAKAGMRSTRFGDIHVFKFNLEKL